MLEEADEAAPQRTLSPQSSKLLNALDRIVRRGRHRGFRLISITQRPAVLHKNVLTQTLIAHRLTSPQDRNAVKAWIEGHGDADAMQDVVGTLASLDVGEAWVWAPDVDLLKRTTMPAIATFDSSATPSPDDEALVLRSRVEFDLCAYDAELALPPASESGDATSPAALAAAQAQGQIDGEAIGYRRGYQAALAAMNDALRTLGPTLADTSTAAAAAAEAIATSVPPVVPTTREKPSGAGQTTKAIPSAARKLLAVLDTNPPVRRTWAQAAALSSLKPRGGHFNTDKRWLLDNAVVIEDGDLVCIATPSDMATAPAKGGAELEQWRAVLPAKAPRLLQTLQEIDDWIDRAALAERLGLVPRGGHWNSSWKALRDNGLIEEKNGAARLVAWLR